MPNTNSPLHPPDAWRAYALFAVIAGCAAPLTPPPARVTAPSQCWLVWHQDGDGAATDEVCEADGGPRVASTTPGVHLLIDARQVEIELTDIDVPALRCTDGGDDIEPVPDQVFHTHRLEILDGDRRVELLEPTNEWGAEELDDRIDLLGSLGPYLAVRRFTHSYDPCGAEPYDTTRVHFFDLRSGESVEMPSPTDAEYDAAGQTVLAQLGRLTAASPPLARALSDFREDWEPGGETSLEESFVEGISLSVVGPGPRYEDGAMRFEFRVLGAVRDNVDAFDTSFPASAPSLFTDYAVAPDTVASHLRGYSRAAVGWTAP